MKKFFSKKGIQQIIRYINEFIKKHYFSFFKEVPLLFCFLITALLNTLLLRIVTVGNWFYIKPLIADLGMLFIFSSFMFLLKSDKKRKRYLFILSLVLSIICIVHSLYYTYYSSFASVSLLATSTFVVDVGDAVVDQVLNFRDFIYLWQPIFVYFYYIKEKKKFNKREKNKCISLLKARMLLVNLLKWSY